MNTYHENNYNFHRWKYFLPCTYYLFAASFLTNNSFLIKMDFEDKMIIMYVTITFII